MRKIIEKRSNRKEVKKILKVAPSKVKKTLPPVSTGKKSTNVVKKEENVVWSPIIKDTKVTKTTENKPAVKVTSDKNTKKQKVVKSTKKNTRTISFLENGMVKMTCNLCKRPEEIKKEDAGWKTLCAPCFLKVRGKLTRCAACKIEFYTLSNPNSACYCYDCTLGMSNGVKSNCTKCKKTFYVSKQSKFSKNTCYDCYLKSTGKESKCTSCSTKIWVKPEDLKWKTKCYNCYIHNN